MYYQKEETADLLDRLYSLGYWLTRSMNKTSDLVRKTYARVEPETSDIDTIKAFRDVFNEDQSEELPEEQASLNNISTINAPILAPDVKLSALLVDICGLTHQDVSNILEQPLDTIRRWIISGRKSLLHNCFHLVIALISGVQPFLIEGLT